MYELTKEKNGKLVPFEWTSARQKAFKVIKAKLATIPVIIYLNFDKPFILYMDASGEGVEAVLHQKDNDGRKQIITCISRTFNEYEKKYPITEQKCLAVVWGVKKFKQYLDIKSFKIITDYMVLKTIQTVDLPSGRRVR